MSGLDADALVAQAVEQTGLDDLGDPSAREGLERLVESVNAEAQLNELGGLGIGGALVAALVNRLRVIDHATNHPEVADEQVEAPVVVVGLFRAGTTLISNLFDCDPANRALLRWESGDSVPPPVPAERRSGPRVEAAQVGTDMLEALNPEVRAIHHEDAESPTECIAVLGQAFRSVSWEAIANVPSYAAWWRADPLANVPAYEFHRTTLRVLQSGGTRGRWVLKSPHHALALDALTAVYPDARLVVLHRDPVVLTASVCSLVRAMSSMFSDADHSAYVREHWTQTLEQSVAGIDAFRAGHPDHPMVDVAYADLVADPVTTMESLYDALGMAPGDGAFAAMAAHVGAHPRSELGTHRYDLATHGLVEAELRERFAAYVERYDVRVETAAQT
ncbi:sulfotransferase [Nocardioides sp.]|uniref:sulfotransferase family protein n=1 Tax=Nocardioides sp. TaxID=35761 RepID=UPI002716E3CC|nr:sulfotransferase [Nocardioides sp.]MDO9457061.1 sulfotransferase [Nocardioides sp.]